MLNWLAENEKICFIGDFNKNYWLQNYTDELKKMTFVTDEVSESIKSNYVVTFIANKEKNVLTFFYDSQTKIEIEIKKGSIDECADRIINCGCGLVGMDLYDLVCILNVGKEASSYYGELTVSEIKQLQKYYHSKVGIYLIIHAPVASTLEEEYLISTEIADLCDSNTNVLRSVVFEEQRSTYSCDLFISGAELSENFKK